MARAGSRRAAASAAVVSCLDMERIHVTDLETALGTLRLAASERGLVWVGLPGSGGRGLAGWLRSAAPESTVEPAFEPCREAARQIVEYLDGKRRRFELVLDLRGTEFQRRVWDALLEIPYGQTCSYGDVARVIGQPAAVRAVGAANGANPIPIIVPCHRVVAAHGIGGYSGGLSVKRRLLALEQDHADAATSGRLL